MNGHIPARPAYVPATSTPCVESAAGHTAAIGAAAEGSWAAHDRQVQLPRAMPSTGRAANPLLAGLSGVLGRLQGAFSGRRTSAVPAVIQPGHGTMMLTRASLHAWATAAGQSPEETVERAAVERKILDQSRPRNLLEPLKLHGNLDLSCYTALTALPAGLNVEGHLDLHGCISLAALPEGLRVGGSLDLSSCKSLAALPVRLSVRRSLYLYGCISLTALPDGFSVGEDLDLRGCISLQALPDRLSIMGFLSLVGCSSLRALPDRLSVGGYLDLGGCVSLRALSDSLSVGGCFYLGGCSSLTALPNSILDGTWGPCADGQPRILDISGTGISSSVVDRLRQTPLEGFLIVLDAPAERHVASNSEKLQRQQVLARLDPTRLPSVRLTPTELVELTEGLCPITQEPLDALATPVLVRQGNGATGHGWTLYEYDALCTWWVEHGSNPVAPQQRLRLGSAADTEGASDVYRLER